MVHVYPLNDLREHDLQSADCACNPRLLIIQGSGMVVVHNAFDAREVLEQFDGFESTVAKWQEELACR